VHPGSSVLRRALVLLLALLLLLLLQALLLREEGGPRLAIHESRRRLFLVRVHQNGAVVRAVGVAGVVVEGAETRLLSKCVDHHA
jgi:hypothetical protein